MIKFADRVHSFNLKYADDIKIYKSFNLIDEKSSRIVLQSNLNSLDNWANN